MPLRRRLTRRPRRLLRKKRAIRKRIARPRRMLNANKQDKAVVVESHELIATPEGGNFIGHQLDQYPRALAVAKNYRYYRCRKVEISFIPYANLFAPGTAFPELYFQIDRTQGIVLPGATLPLPTKNMMLARGVMPIKWTGVVNKSYSPSVCRLENLWQNKLGDSLTGIAGTTTTPVLYKWYATQQVAYGDPPQNAASPVMGNYSPASLRYFGAAYFIDQPLAPPSAVLGTIKMRVHWEFKQPLWTQDISDLSGNSV